MMLASREVNGWRQKLMCKLLNWKFNESFEYIYRMNSAAAVGETSLSQF
jgi:hypothetical protein